MLKAALEVEYATTDNFAGRVICGSCGRVFGRKVWNSTDDRLRRIVWRCNGKYVVKGEKGCESRHIDDEVLYQAFVDVFNAMIENRITTEKCRDRLVAKCSVRYKSKQLLETISGAERVTEFDVDLYFSMSKSTTV